MKLNELKAYGYRLKIWDTYRHRQSENRLILRKAMLRHGFEPIDSEWWHFTLRNEPFLDTYFDFPVKQL